LRSAAALVVIVLSPWPSEAQPSPRLAGLLERFEPYLRLVQQYRDGDDERAVQVIKEFSERSRDSLEDAVEAWKELVTDRSIGFDALASQRKDLKGAREPRALEAAALLHTIVGIVGYERGGSPFLQFHLAMARRLTALRDSPSAAAQAFDTDWNRVVAVFFHGLWALDEAKPYMDTALELSPADGDLLVAAARLFEARHSYQMTQLRRRYDPGVTQSPGTIQEQMLRQARAAGEIARAETLLRSALAGRTAPPPARLRLGRILQAGGRLAESEAELRAVMDHSSGDDAGYLARLFLARIYEDGGRTSEAAALYEAATRIRPRNQSARIGLARLLAKDGRRDEASALVQAAVTTERAGHDEPWWFYYYPDENALTILVARIRERLR